MIKILLLLGLGALGGTLAVCVGCAPEHPADPGSPAQAVAADVLRPVPLPAGRHGHRVERVSSGLLCCGGFGPGEERGMRDTLWLAPGATQWQPRARMSVGRAFFATV